MIAPIVTGSMAADAQTSAASTASNTQLSMFNQMQQNLQPYMQTGAGANSALSSLSGIGAGGNPLTSALLSPVNMNQATLDQTPGYQFNLTQGLKATQNSAAARGLGVSGAALKGAANYATGLADSTYQNQFSNAVTNQTNDFNRLLNLTQLGQNSAAGVGQAGISTGNSIAQNTLGAANATAASLMNAGNQVSSAGQTAGLAALLA